MLRDIDKKICSIDSLVSTLWRPVAWVLICAKMNNGKNKNQSPGSWFLESLQQNQGFQLLLADHTNKHLWLAFLQHSIALIFSSGYITKGQLDTIDKNRTREWMKLFRARHSGAHEHKRFGNELDKNLTSTPGWQFGSGRFFSGVGFSYPTTEVQFNCVYVALLG